GVVDQQRAPGLHDREAQALRTVGLEHARFTAPDVLAPHHQDGDEVDAVPVRALGRRPTDAARGVDAELVRLDVPARYLPQPGEQAAETDDGGRPGGIALDRRLDRLEPALEPAVQRVVVHRLPVGAVGGPLDAAVGQLEDVGPVAPPPVATTVTQVAVGWQALPARTQLVEKGRRHIEQAGHRRRIQPREAFLAQRRERAGRPAAGLAGGPWVAQRFAHRGSAEVRLAVHDPRNEPVLDRFLGAHPVVTVDVGAHLLDRLAGTLRDDRGDPLADLQDLARLDRDVRRPAAGAPGRLVDHEP